MKLLVSKLNSQNTKYMNEKLTLFSERSRTDMLEERSRRVKKRDFAKVQPRLLSENFNEHRDLAAAATTTTTTKKDYEKKTAKFDRGLYHILILSIVKLY